MLRFALIILLVFTIISCEEVIEVKLDNADPQFVIEANISDNPDNNIVKITKSTDFYKPSNYEAISGAEIIVNESNGETHKFVEDDLGIYKNQELKVKEGNNYSLKVNYNNKVYTASSRLTKKIFIDSIAVVEDNRPFQDELDYEIHCYFQDNIGIKDYIRFKVYVNGIQENRIFTYNDRLTDGNSIDYNRFRLGNDDDDQIGAGDEIKIELLTIDENAFEYFDTLRDVLASASSGAPGGGTAPSNPTTNLNNNALGYFSAYSIDSKTVKIK